MDEERARVPAGTMAGWSNRKTGQTISSFEEEALKGSADALIFYVNPASWVPVWLQKVGLWFKRYVFRRAL